MPSLKEKLLETRNDKTKRAFSLVGIKKYVLLS